MGEFKNKHKSNTYYIGKTTDSQPDWNSLQIQFYDKQTKMHQKVVSVWLLLGCLEETSAMRKLWRNHFAV